MNKSDENIQQLFDFAFIPSYDKTIRYLATIADNENWDFPDDYSYTEKRNTILRSYLEHTFRRIKQENKIAYTPGDDFACFNTGLVTKNLEEIYALFGRNQMPGRQPYVFNGFYKKSNSELIEKFGSNLPDSANYLSEPEKLIYNPHLNLIWQIEHIINDNIDRFPPELRSCSDDELRMRVEGAIQEARKRVRLNYRLAIPQYFNGEIQMLLPINLTDGSTRPDMALAVRRLDETTYTARTCLTLKMAYNNARLIHKPQNNWLTDFLR